MQYHKENIYLLNSQCEKHPICIAQNTGIKIKEAVTDGFFVFRVQDCAAYPCSHNGQQYLHPKRFPDAPSPLLHKRTSGN